MKTILVTGGAGFIGANLCRKLLDLDNRVIALDNLITSTGENIKSLLKYQNFTFIKQDITKPNWKFEIEDLKLEIIYHLACPTGVPNVVTFAEEMLSTCSVGTKNILDLAQHHNAKMLFTSSSEVYGNPLVSPQTEEYTGNVDPLGIRSPYEEGKRFSESLIIAYVRKYGLDAKIVRIFNTYGPFMNLEETRVIPNFMGKIQKGEPLPVQGDGSQQRTFCYVDDLINGFLTVMEKGKSGEVYNDGNDEQITIRGLAELLLKMTGSPVGIEYTNRPSHDHQSRLPDLRKLKTLGWKTRISLEEGLQKTIQWYTNHRGFASVNSSGFQSA